MFIIRRWQQVINRFLFTFYSRVDCGPRTNCSDFGRSGSGSRVKSSWICFLSGSSSNCSCSTVSSWMGDCPWSRKPSHYVASHLGRLSLLHSGMVKWVLSFGFSSSKWWFSRFLAQTNWLSPKVGSHLAFVLYIHQTNWVNSDSGCAINIVVTCYLLRPGLKSGLF